MAGFVECMDNEESEEGMENEEGNMENFLTCCCFHKMLYSPCFFFPTDQKCSDPESQKKVARIRHETQIHILNLLITSLELNPPNLALYLLGYEVKKPVSSTNLQDPGDTSNQIPAAWLRWPCCRTDGELLCVAGVLGCPRSCLHAILSLLQKGTERRSGPVLAQQAPHLAELCYQVHMTVLGSTLFIWCQYLNVFFLAAFSLR